MKNNITIKIPYILNAIFAIFTVIVVLIVYNIVHIPFSLNVIIGYIVFLVASVLYFTVLTVKNVRRLKWPDIRRRIFNFMILLILFVSLKYALKYGFKPAKVDFLSDFFGPIGSALGLSFFDLVFMKKKD